MNSKIEKDFTWKLWFRVKSKAKKKNTSIKLMSLFMKLMNLKRATKLNK